MGGVGRSSLSVVTSSTCFEKESSIEHELENGNVKSYGMALQLSLSFRCFTQKGKPSSNCGVVNGERQLFKSFDECRGSCPIIDDSHFDWIIQNSQPNSCQREKS